MESESGGKKHLESVISLCLLRVLAIIAAEIILKQRPKQAYKSRPDLDYLISDGFIWAWKTEIYHSGNLYEKINSEAAIQVQPNGQTGYSRF